MEQIINNKIIEKHLRSNDLIKSDFMIRTKKGEVVKFVPNKSQLKYRKMKTRRNLVLKGRQQGLSKEIDADQLADCLKKATNAVVISHEKEATKRMFSAVKFYVDNLTPKVATSIDSKTEMKFPEVGSNYYIGTAGQKAFGRGDTINRAHLSEGAFYENFEMILAGISEASEYGQIDIETTANGRNGFYDQWQKAKNGRSPYTCIFIPWYLHDEYNSDKMEEEDKDGLSPAVQEMFMIPDQEFEINESEKELIRKAKQNDNIDILIGQLKWRRYKIWDKGDLFFQEYPEDDESCFLQSGRSVFKHLRTDKSLRIPLDTPERMSSVDINRLLGKDKGNKRKTLYAGLDPAEGTPTGDAHSFAVIEPNSPYLDRGKSAVIFEITSNDPREVFLTKVKKVCDMFRIRLAIEDQGVGVAMTQKAKEMRIKFESWTTSGTTRPPMILDLEEAYRKEEMVESYPEAETEARNMIYNDSNRAEHPKGKHDDRVFARAIAYQIMKLPKPSVDFF